MRDLNKYDVAEFQRNRSLISLRSPVVGDDGESEVALGYYLDSVVLDPNRPRGGVPPMNVGTERPAYAGVINTSPYNNDPVLNTISAVRNVPSTTWDVLMQFGRDGLRHQIEMTTYSPEDGWYQQLDKVSQLFISGFDATPIASVRMSMSAAALSRMNAGYARIKEEYGQRVADGFMTLMRNEDGAIDVQMLNDWTDVWHTSGAEFDTVRINADTIGKGEGAALFFKGHYTAEAAGASGFNGWYENRFTRRALERNSGVGRAGHPYEPDLQELILEQMNRQRNPDNQTGFHSLDSAQNSDKTIVENLVLDYTQRGVDSYISTVMRNTEIMIYDMQELSGGERILAEAFVTETQRAIIAINKATEEKVTVLRQTALDEALAENPSQAHMTMEQYERFGSEGHRLKEELRHEILDLETEYDYLTRGADYTGAGESLKFWENTDGEMVSYSGPEIIERKNSILDEIDALSDEARDIFVLEDVMARKLEGPESFAAMDEINKSFVDEATIVAKDIVLNMRAAQPYIYRMRLEETSKYMRWDDPLMEQLAIVDKIPVDLQNAMLAYIREALPLIESESSIIARDARRMLGRASPTSAARSAAFLRIRDGSGIGELTGGEFMHLMYMMVDADNTSLFNAASSKSSSNYLQQFHGESIPTHIDNSGDIKSDMLTFMQSIDIPGVKYLDQLSRPGRGGSGGPPSFNYVTYNERLVKILERYAILPPVGLGMMINEMVYGPDLDDPNST